MPLFMDQHDAKGAEPENLAQAHQRDLAIQDSYNVRFLTYWLDYGRGIVNCLVEAATPEVVNEVHARAHGMLANRVIPVDRSEVAVLLGRLTDPEDGIVEEPAQRTFVFTDMVGSTALFEALGDDAANRVRRDHDRLVRNLLVPHLGREVKHTGDGFMLVFASPVNALSFAESLQAELAEKDIAVRIGINAGSPLAEGGDFFGMAVNVAARLCELGAAGDILVSPDVVDEASAEGFRFVPIGPRELRGLSAPLIVYRLETTSISDRV